MNGFMIYIFLTKGKKNIVVGAKDSVKSISFAPRHFGLKLAAGSLDGVVRIYDAMDVMNLSHWVETASFEVSPAGSEVSLSWNTSRSEAQTLVTGGPNGVRIFGFNGREWAVVGVCDTHDTLEVSWAANVGRSSHLIAASTRENGVRLHSVKLPTQDRAFQSSVVAEFSEHRCLVRRLSWNITGTLLCSSGDDGAVRYWKCNHIGQWKCVGVHSPANSRESEVGDVVIPAARVV
jgi:nucleoporin SEH1